MSHLTPTPPAPGAPSPKVASQVAREQIRQRVRSYKRGLTVAAFVGFSAFGLLIGRPDLNIATTGSPATQTTTSTPTTSNQTSSSGTYFTQQGGSTTATSTSTATPATSSHTS